MAAISTCFFTVTPTRIQSILFSQKPSSFVLKPSRIHSFNSWNLSNNGYRRSSVHLVRASLDVEVKTGGIVESDKLPSDVRKRAMDAIDALGKRVTVGDVASKAGLQLSEAQKSLQALATDTNGFLEVNIAFIFMGKKIDLSMLFIFGLVKSIAWFVKIIGFLSINFFM